MYKSKEHRETKREERKRVLFKMNSKKLTDYFLNTTSSSTPEKQQGRKQEQENNEIVIADKYHPP